LYDGNSNFGPNKLFATELARSIRRIYNADEYFNLGAVMHKPRTLQIATILPATPSELFNMYLDPNIHEAITGAPVTIAAKAGAAFSAFDGALTGTILQVKPKKLIVQSWRSSNWSRTAIDSTLVLTFWPEGKNGRIELVQVNVPDNDFAGVSQGWEMYYWTPWRDYLKKRSTRPRRLTVNLR
jgi:activator of HSP90 ATPase